MTKTLLEMREITKKFPGVHALKCVDFSLDYGEVHALLGENGAGKSTLMKVLGGVYSNDEGSITLDGEKIEINSVKDASNNGISFIHQEIVLVPYLSIAENLFLGREPLNSLGLINKQKIYEDTQRLIDDFDLNLKASTPINRLSVAQQQMIEIIKAVSFNSKIIIMDEPTSSLSDKEVTFLFKTIRNLKAKGVGIVYISHRMSELFEITDRITIMRDGAYIGTVTTKDTTNDQLISMMVGRDLEKYYIRDFIEAKETVLEVKQLAKKGVLTNNSFELKKGEILGFSGLVGAGRSELMKCIFGLDLFDEGEIHTKSGRLKIKNPNDAIKEGIAYVTENRKEEGLFLGKSVQYNTTIKILDQFIRLFRVNKSYEVEKTNGYIKSLAIKTPNQEQAVGNLSGGNQQKVLISRWLATNPTILILDEPTRGVDVGAKTEIYSIMNELVKEGVSIIMVSSDLPEILNMSDRVAVMYKGTIQKIICREELSQEAIMNYATGGV